MRDFLGLPIDASTTGQSIDSMIVIVHWLMLVLFVGWGGFFIYSLIRFRRSRNPRADYVGIKSHFSTYSEVAIAIFEAFLLVGLAFPVWSNVVSDFPDEKDAVVIRIVGEQFAWNAHYPGPDGVFGRRDIKLISSENPLGLDRNDPAAKDDITTINQLNIPVGKPVLIYLTTKDVIHSFGIPLLRVKHDAIPGEEFRLTFTATVTSTQIQEMTNRRYHIAPDKIPVELTNLSAREDYSDKQGTSILTKGTTITKEAIDQLLAAGITEVSAGSDNPVEIACAQLCGLGHYRMRGAVNIQTPAEYQAWLSEEASYLTQ